MKINFHDEVSAALHFDKPVVALESTVIAHGLPYPNNIETAESMEQIVRDAGAVPATIAMFGGVAYVGLNRDQLEQLARGEDVRKVSIRDLPIAVARKLDCATTVASTAFIAQKAGIKVFATGGIGGVHRGRTGDVSADLIELARTPITVVCSGAKVILDVAATREWLETVGICVLGWKCDEVPAFYSRSSGLPVDQRIESSREAADISKARDEMGLQGAILITVPVPAEHEIPNSEVEMYLADSLADAAAKGITGGETTPFLLNSLSEKSGGKTLAANIALLENNARIAAEIARSFD